MGKVVDALIDGTPLGKLVWDAIGVDAWWEIGVGKYVREALIPIPDDDFGNEAMSQQQMLRSPTEARRSIYGKAMVSGPIVFAAETGTDNEYLHLVIPLAAHQCADVLEIYFDDEVVYQNGSLDTAYSKHARINIHLGTQTAADSDLLAECEHWTASHIGLGITYLYVRLKHDPEFYANGLPNIKALVQGKPLYDPRKDSTVGGSGSHRWDDESSWEWSDNWALCVLDYTRFESGVGALVNEIDLPSYALAANDSDQLVEYDDEGNTEKRYTCNGTFTQSMTPASVLDKLLTAGAGMQTYSSGKYQLFSGVYQGPHLLTIGEADLAGEVEVRPFNARAQLCNAVRGTFVDPDNFYQPTDFAPYESDYYRAQDNGEYIDHDIDLPFTQSAYTAQRLAKLHLELNRAGQQIVAPLNMIGLSVSVGQVVELDLPRLGIKAEYQVMDWQFDFGQPIKVTLRETGPALFDYDKGSYTDRKLTPVLNLPSSKRVPTVTGVLWTPMGDDANWQGLLAWNAPGGNSAYRYRLEVSNGLNVVVYQATIDGTRHHIPKLDAGNYTITLWAVNLFANRSNVPATIAIGADAPPAVTGILVDTGALELTLRPQTAAITATTTEFEVKGGLSSDISNAQFIGQGKEVIWPGRHANTQYFVWARATNNFGTSAWFGPIIAHTTSDKSAIVNLLGNTFDKYTWFAWADDKQGTGFTTDEAIGDGKAYLGQAINKDTATPSGNWQDYTWSKIQTDIPELFTPAEEAALDNLIAGKLPTGDKDMLALQDALNDPNFNNNMLTAQQLLNQGINAAGIGGETPSGAQSKADVAKAAAIAAAAADASTKANNAKTQAEAAAALDALNKANAARDEALSSSVAREVFSFYGHYNSAVILLIPYFNGAAGWGESEIFGQLTFRRGGNAASNRTERIDISAKTAYNTTNFSMNKSNVSWNWKFCTVTYNGLKWLALQSGGNIQDARWEFWGRRTLSSISTVGTYLASDQFRLVPYYKSGDPGGGNGVLNSEVFDSIVFVTPTPTKDAAGNNLETEPGAQSKANNAETNAVSTVSLGNFVASTGLIQTLLANSGLFNTLKAEIASFNGLTAETIAALAIATNHLQAGAVTSDKLTADTALINKLVASQGLFDALQARLAVFGGLAAQSIAANSISTKHLTITNTDNICTNPKFTNSLGSGGNKEGWSGITVQWNANPDAYGGASYLGLINNNRDTYFNYEKPFSVLDGERYYLSLYAYHYQNPTADLRLGLMQRYSDGSMGWNTFLARAASDRGAANFASGWLTVGNVAGKKVVSATLFIQMNGTSGAMGGGYYVSNVYLRKMASAELIVDGAITTQKIVSKAITTDKIAANAVTANELLADSALINKLVASQGLFNDLVARLAVFGGLTANSIAAGAILGTHIKAGEKISSPIIEGGEVRLIGSNFMKVSAASSFGPDGLIEWYGPKLLVGGNPDWANLRKNNAITYLAANGDAYFGGSLSAGILKNSVATSDKNKYAAGTSPISLGPFSTNGRTKVVVVSFDMRASTRYSSNPGTVSAPVLKWQLQKLINGTWTSLTSGTYQGTASVYFENDDPSNTYWQESQSCQGSTTYTDISTSSADVTYRILVTSYYRNAVNAVVSRQLLSIISTEQ